MYAQQPSRSSLDFNPDFDARRPSGSIARESLDQRNQGSPNPHARPPREQSRPRGQPSREPEPLPPPHAYDYDGEPGSGRQSQAYLPEGDDFYTGSQTNFQAPISVASQSVRQPSPPPAPILDHSHLRPGEQAALQSHQKTLEQYRANAKKTQDPDMQLEFAIFMIDASKTMPIPVETLGNVMEVEKAIQKREDLVREAISLLKRNADRGHMPSQYFLADCYANGVGTPKNKQDFDKAFPLFVLAAKHGHGDAAYRAGTCCENGWGCRRESAKALTFFRKAAAAIHPGALYRLGLAELNGELGLTKNAKQGVAWLKRSAEHATAEFPHALHELALLHERGIDNVLFVDYEYATELLAQAAELGYAPSAHRLGECYEYGKMGCPQDAALSIHYYNIAAQQNHRDACFALTAWYLVGSEGVLPQSDTEAYLWARRAAEAGLTKAMYAVGYFLEVGIGVPPDMHEAVTWYKKAASLGDKRAARRLQAQTESAIVASGGPGSVVTRDVDDIGGGGGKQKDKDCIIM